MNNILLLKTQQSESERPNECGRENISLFRNRCAGKTSLNRDWKHYENLSCSCSFHSKEKRITRWFFKLIDFFVHLFLNWLPNFTRSNPQINGQFFNDFYRYFHFNTVHRIQNLIKFHSRKNQRHNVAQINVSFLLVLHVSNECVRKASAKTLQKLL